MKQKYTNTIVDNELNPEIHDTIGTNCTGFS